MLKNTSKTIHFILDRESFGCYCIVLSLAVRLLWLFLINPDLSGDALFFHEKACQISDGLGYTYQGQPTAFYPVGYPAFLAGLYYFFGKSVFIARLANIFLYMIILLVFRVMMQKISKNHLFTSMALLLLAFYPNHIAYTNLLFNETLFAALFLWASCVLFIALEHKKIIFFVASGLLFGCAALVRPAVALCPLIVLVLKLLNNQGRLKWISGIFILLLCMELVLIPWQIRNYRHFNSFIFVSTNFSHNLFVGNHEEATGRYAPITSEIKRYKAMDSEEQYDSFAMQSVKQYICQKPFEALKRIPLKVYYFMYPGMEGISWNMKGLENSQLSVLRILRLMGNAGYLLLLFLFFASVIDHQFNRKRLYSFGEKYFLAMIVYYLLVSMIFFGESRYHFHLIPFVIWFVSVFISDILHEKRLAT